MTEPTIFVPGDIARYHGPVAGTGLDIVLAGDVVKVYRGNLDDPDDEVCVTREGGAPIHVDPHELEWLSGG